MKEVIHSQFCTEMYQGLKINADTVKSFGNVEVSITNERIAIYCYNKDIICITNETSKAVQFLGSLEDKNSISVNQATEINEFINNNF